METSRQQIVAELASSEVRMRHGDPDSVSNTIEAWPRTAIEPPLVDLTLAGVMPRSVWTK